MSFLPSPGDSRALVTQPASAMLARFQTADLISYCLGIRGALTQNYNLLEGVPKVDGFSSLRLKEQADILSLVYRGDKQLAEPLADFLGVAQVIFPDNLSAWQARSNYMPLVTVGQQPVFVGQTEILKVLGGDDFEPRRKVYLPLEARGAVRAADVSNATSSALEFSAHRVAFLVQTDVPTMAVVSQSYYHNWRAFVDGQPVRLWRANHAFQALEVPAGRHKVELVYRDRAFMAGAVISGGGLVIGLLFLTRRDGLYIRTEAKPSA